MYCLLSFIFTLIVSIQTLDQLFNDSLSILQILYNIYGFIMVYQTSKPYWSKTEEERRKSK